MTGRPSNKQSTSSHSLIRQISSLNLEQNEPTDETVPGDGPTLDSKTILSQVVDWLLEEKAKEAKRRHRRSRRAVKTPLASAAPSHAESLGEQGDAKDDEEDLSLDKLEKILAGFAFAKDSAKSLSRRPSAAFFGRGSAASLKLKRGSMVRMSSDTEFQDGDLLVPNVEAALDNSKTMAFTGGAADDDDAASVKSSNKEQKNWIAFKEDILRLTHTLKLKGWRRIPIENGGDMVVERLSGALTNAVYVVTPPKNVTSQTTTTDDAAMPVSRRPPSKLLLRVYGPQVEHLIDRDSELAILRRLARKQIGPRMLGTFTNGRFEQFFNARTLTAEDLRIPDTSKQIAKRMRELHDGIELLEGELSGGPAVFLNWDKWVDRCEKVITWLDEQVKQAEIGTCKLPSRYTKQGLICGVEWPKFRAAVDKYRKLLYETYGGKRGVRQQLVFAHNDTQYGNLMRLKPSGESPLLQPANEHKQLVVIDFEYASANTPGLEFANHFTEWCYNYHHPERSYACNTKAYPTPEEQYRFVRSYVMHRPQFNPAASATPMMLGREKTNIDDFMLDARNPGVDNKINYDVEEKARVEAAEKEIQRFLEETRFWRVANSAQWVAWGIVQAKVPELDEAPKHSRASAIIDKVKTHLHPQSDPLTPEIMALAEDAKHDRPEGREQEEAHEEGDEEGEDEFDYLAYAQERAMFFWGDCLQLGIVKEEDLPEKMNGMIKIVKY
jgi:choline kinase